MNEDLKDKIDGMENDVQSQKFKERWYRKLLSSIGLLHQRKAKTDQHELLMQITLRKFIVYLLFLTNLMIVSFSVRDVNMFYLTNVIQNTFTHRSLITESALFIDVSNQTIFWKYMSMAFHETIYWRPTYDPVKVEIAGETDLAAPRDLFFENKILGAIRMRQVRVRHDSCTIPAVMKRLFSNCYGYYNAENEDRGPYGPKDAAPFLYSTALETGADVYYGYAGTYGGGGYYLDIPAHDENAFATYKMYLYSNLWTDKATRAVFVDFTLYNSGLNLFCVIKLVFEFLPTGGILPVSHFRTGYLLRYTSSYDFIKLACEVILFFFLMYYTVIIVRTFHRSTRPIYFFLDLWNIASILMIVLLYSYLMFAVYNYFVVNQIFDSVSHDEEERYINLDTISTLYAKFETVKAIALFLAWIEIFKYITLNKTLLLIGATIKTCIWDICTFCLMFGIFFFAFAQMAVMLFGNHVEKYRTITNGMFSLLRTLLGDFEFDEIQEVNKFTGRMFYLLHVFIVFFILLNVFLAIISETYAKVRLEVSTTRQYYLTHFLKQGVKKVSKLITKREQQQQRRRRDEIPTNDELKDIFRKGEITDIELEMFFEKYNIDLEKLTEAIDQIKIINDLKEGFKLNPLPRNIPLTRQKLQDFIRKVEKAETIVDDVIPKIDSILEML